MPEIYDERHDERDELRDDVEKDEEKKDKKIWKPGPWMLGTGAVLGICYVIGKLTGGSVDGSVDVNHHMDGDIDMSHTGKVELPVSGEADVNLNVDTITYQEACKKCPEDKQDDCEECKKENKKKSSGSKKSSGTGTRIYNNNGNGTQSVNQTGGGEGITIINNNGGTQPTQSNDEEKAKSTVRVIATYRTRCIPASERCYY